MESLMETAATTNEGEQTSTGTEQQGATDQPQTTEAVTTEETAPEGAPEQYELKAQEGQEFDTEFLKTYTEVARELNLTNDKAQMLIDKLSPVIQQNQMAKIEAIRTEWADSSKADKEFGGDKLKENLGIAKQALDKFGTPELKELINQSGLGNHPEMIRFFYRAGKSITADTFVGGQKGDGQKSTGLKSFNDFADALYAKQ